MVQKLNQSGIQSSPAARLAQRLAEMQNPAPVLQELPFDRGRHDVSVLELNGSEYDTWWSYLGSSWQANNCR